jgi:hypothetical protein
VEDAPEVNCELVDLTGISLDELRHTTDESVAASVRTMLLDVSDPVHRTARMNSSGSDCSGSLLPERLDEGIPVPLITC